MWMSTRPLLLGTAFALPFFIANVLVAMHSPLFLSLIRPSGESSGGEQILVLVLIALVGIGGLFALLPLVSERKFYTVNALVGITMILFAIFAGYGLGEDVYHCNILQIPNCD